MSIKIEATEPKGFINIDAGVYAATVAAVEPAEGEFGSQVKFVFRLDDEVREDGAPIELWAWASQKLTRATKLWKWIVTFTGSAPVIGQTFDVSTLAGLPCRVLINMEATDDGQRARVVDVQGAKSK